jgi:type 1 glutamine amidotransferase
MPDLIYVTEVAPYVNRIGGNTDAVAAGVHQGLASSVLAFEQLAGLCGLSFGHVPRVQQLSVDDLETCRVIALYTIGETGWSDEQRRVIETRVGLGELAFVGVHSAADAAAGWPGYGAILGARFDGHPVTTELPISVVDPHHPATAHLPALWRFRDELYVFRELATDARVLLAMQIGGRAPGAEPNELGPRDLPLAWCLERGAMRSFYTALGHFVSAFEDVNYLRHLRGGLNWVLGGP